MPICPNKLRLAITHVDTGAHACAAGAVCAPAFRAAHGRLVGSLNAGVWLQHQVAIASGIPVSDLVRHFAHALHHAHGLADPEVLTRIRRVFGTEVDRTSAETKAKFV